VEGRAGEKLLWSLKGEASHGCLGEALKEGAGPDISSAVQSSSRERCLSKLEERRLG